MLSLQINGNKIFAPLLNKELIATPEEKVRQEYICRIVNHYGFSLEQMTQEIQVNNSKRGQGKARADIVVWKNKKDKENDISPIIVIECKAEQVKIREEDYFQGYNYASRAGADFFVTTNLKETKIFRVMKGKIPKKLEEIIDIPFAKDVEDEKKIQKLLTETKAFTRDEFSKLLMKCHNIIRNNDKLSPEGAFDEISKILFMKIRYERQKPTEHTIFSLEKFEKDENHYNENVRPYIKGEDSNTPYLQILFRQTKDEFKSDNLFEENENIKIREQSFKSIVKELEIYNLSDTSDDIKGIAFEQFLGKTFRGELGQFFTPRTIVDYIVEVLNPQEGETICDPCCGSGGFLIKAFEYVKSQIESKIQAEKEKIKEQYFDEKFDKLAEKEQEKVTEKVNEMFEKLNIDLDNRIEGSRMHDLSYNCIFGTDANPRMARVSKMNMIMHGDGHGGVHHHDGLLNVNGIFENRFDVIITNPPFGARVDKNYKVNADEIYKDEERIKEYKKRYGTDYEQALKQITDNVDKPLLDLYDLGSVSGLTEVLFMERCLRLLKKGGRLGIVLPEGVLNSSQLQKVRDYFMGKAKILLITSIPQDVFMSSGATVKCSLLFIKKLTESEEQGYISKQHETLQELHLTLKPSLDSFLWLKLDDSIEREHHEEYKNIHGGVKKLDKETKAKLKNRQENMKSQFLDKLKTKLNYQIPIVEVEKAGISTTGGEIENDLLKVLEEYKTYREQTKPRTYGKKQFAYRILGENIEKSQI